MTTRRSIGWGGFWYLVGMTALGAAVWTLVAVLWWREWSGLPLWSLILGGVVFMAVLVPVGLVIGWNSRGGRAAFRETYGWIRAGSVPAVVPEWVWRPRVTQIRQDVRMNGIAALVSPVVFAFLCWSAAAGGSGPSWGSAAVWAGLIAVNAVRWLRWHGRVRRLLDGPQPSLHIPDGWRNCPPRTGI